MATIFESARQKVLDVLDSVLTAPETRETDTRPVIEQLQQRINDAAEAASQAAREASQRLSNLKASFDSLKRSRERARKTYNEVSECVAGAATGVELYSARLVDSWDESPGNKGQVMNLIQEFTTLCEHGPKMITRARSVLTTAEKEFSDFVKTNRKDLVEMQLPLD